MNEALSFIMVVSVIVMIHEIGHYVAAKIVGVKVKSFSLFLPPKLFSIFKYKETEFSIGMIPLGGYIMLDESALNEHPGKEFFVSIMGPVFNFISAYIFIVFVLAFYTESSVVNSFVSGVSKFSDIFSSIYDSITSIFTSGQEVVVSGPVGIGRQAAQYTEKGVVYSVIYLAFMSIYLGVFNLMPFPPLDGFSVVKSFYEIVTGKKVNKTVALVANVTGLFMFIGLLIYGTMTDITG